MNHSSRAPPLPKALDIFGAVEELHNLSAKEMNKLLRESQHLFTLRLRTGRGSSTRVDLERFVLSLPLHLLACLASRGIEPRLRYLLRGVRLLHSLSDLALRHPKLEQILLLEVKIREQILDLIVYMLITLASPEQEARLGGSFTLLHAALVACSLHLLPAFVAAEWSDVVPVLLVHPKVDIFMDVAFDAVRRDIGLLQSKLRVLNSRLLSNKITATVAECMAQVIAQQCEASVQVLQSLCQPHAFRDRLLNHKELCRNGGLLRLALTVLKLQLPQLLAESKYLVSLISRLKSKILSMLVKFCETESVSFLDEVAADVKTMHLADMVAAEVLALVRNALLEEPKDTHGLDENDEIPSGLLYIHALRLADIFSDDSNFRNLVMDHIAPDLAKVLAQSPTVFSSEWCGSSVVDDAMKPGSDAVLIYDPFRAAGAAMQSFKSTTGLAARASGTTSLLSDDLSGCSLSAGQIQFASYSQERSSLFVKILANLHCFNPEICAADEKDRFLNLFIECLMVGPFTPGNSAFFLSTVQTAVRVCENLFLLLDHVSSLPSEAVSDEDLQLVSTFYYALHEAICPSGFSEATLQEDPVVSYVKDAHEQKRKILLAQWQRSERWQRIRLSEASDKEHSNAGSSINKTSTKTSSSQPGVDNDTCQLSEEGQSFGDQSVAKRKREVYEPDDETRIPKKKDSQPFEREMTDLDLEWLGEAETNKLMNMAADGGMFGKDILEEAGLAEVAHTINDDVDNTQVMERGQYDSESVTEYEVATVLGSTIADDLPFTSENEVPLQNKQDIENDDDDIPLNEDDFKIGVKLEDVDIYDDAEDIKDHHPCMDFSKSEEMSKEVQKCEDMNDDTQKLVVGTRQESSQSAAEAALVSVSEMDNQVFGSCIIPKTISGMVYEELQPKKRKRNIMNEKQMAMMENALITEPDMQRYPKLIIQWTNRLNTIGPELSSQQLKNWLNNRKARLARQARETRGFEGETQVAAFNNEAVSSLEPAYQTRSAPGQSSTYSGSSNDPRGAMSEDGNTRDSGSPVQNSRPSVSTGISQCKPAIEDVDALNQAHMELDAYYNHSCELADICLTSGPSHRSASVKFVKCEIGQYVSLLDKDGIEVATGTVHQVEGVWQGKRIDEHGLCLVMISQLKVDKTMKLPHPSSSTGNSFEEAEKLFGRMLVAWDTKRIFLIG